MCILSHKHLISLSERPSLTSLYEITTVSPLSLNLLTLFFSKQLPPSKILFLDSLVAQMARMCLQCGRQFQSLGRKIPGRREIAAHSNALCLEKSMDRGLDEATIHGGHKESDTLIDFTSNLYLLFVFLHLIGV